MDWYEADALLQRWHDASCRRPDCHHDGPPPAAIVLDAETAALVAEACVRHGHPWYVARQGQWITEMSGQEIVGGPVQIPRVGAAPPGGADV